MTKAQLREFNRMKAIAARLPPKPRPQMVARVKSADRRVYGRMSTGSLVRMSPQRPWRGKAERRAVIKRRREEKEAV